MRRPTTLREADILSGAILAVLGVFVLVQSLQMTFYNENEPGPGFFPVLLAIALIVLGGCLVVTRLRAPRDAADDFEMPTGQQAKRSLSLWAALLGAALLVGSLGFLLTMFLLVAVILFVIEGRRGLGSVLTTITVPVLAWLLFGQLLQVRLPTGPLGI